MKIINPNSQKTRSDYKTCGYQRVGGRRKVVKRYKYPVIQKLNIRDVMYDMLTTANITIQYIGKVVKTKL